MPSWLQSLTPSRVLILGSLALTLVSAATPWSRITDSVSAGVVGGVPAVSSWSDYPIASSTSTWPSLLIILLLGVCVVALHFRSDLTGPVGFGVMAISLVVGLVLGAWYLGWLDPVHTTFAGVGNIDNVSRTLKSGGLFAAAACALLFLAGLSERPSQSLS